MIKRLHSMATGYIRRITGCRVEEEEPVAFKRRVLQSISSLRASITLRGFMLHTCGAIIDLEYSQAHRKLGGVCDF